LTSFWTTWPGERRDALRGTSPVYYRRQRVTPPDLSNPILKSILAARWAAHVEVLGA